MAYFKRNTELVDKAKSILNTNTSLTDEEKTTLMGIVERYENNTFKSYDDKEEFFNNAVEDMVNDMGFNPYRFAEKTTYWHRTLQQTFFNIVLAVIRNYGSDSYNYDGRNQSSHEIASKLNKALNDYGMDNYNCPCI